jgi:hypothetical protein
MDAEMIVKNEKRFKLPEGLTPICSYCKKIRDDSGKDYGEGNWERMEDYITKETGLEFTHGICPDCIEIAFPHFNEKVNV